MVLSDGSGSQAHERLLAAVAEQLKLPLLQIARGAEISEISHADIAYTANVALRLIDSYILSIIPAQEELPLEPIAVSAVLQDTAHRLSKLASQYGCQLEMNIAGKYGPVMANKQSLEAAFTMLGYSFIESQSYDEKPGRVVFAAHKSAKGQVAGVFGTKDSFSTDLFRQAKALYGTARQPMASSSAGSSAGLFIADSLLGGMATKLRVAKHNKLSGLAVTLFPSQQLQFGGI